MKPLFDLCSLFDEPYSMLRIRVDQLERIHRALAQVYPAEGCGFLWGRADANAKSVEEVVVVANQRSDTPSSRYLIGPEAVQSSEKLARAEGLEIIGFFHSHPDFPARPSEYDREHAWPWYSYLIVSVDGGEPADTLCWRLREDRSGFDPEELEVLAPVS